MANVKRKLEEMAQISEEVDVFNLHSLINTRGVVWVQKKINELKNELKKLRHDLHDSEMDSSELKSVIVNYW